MPVDERLAAGAATRVGTDQAHPAEARTNTPSVPDVRRCTTDGCERAPVARRLCRRCYDRGYSKGSLDVTPRGQRPKVVGAAWSRPSPVVLLAPLPRPTYDGFDREDVLEALIETIVEDLSDEELDACSQLPIGQDPVYWLVRKHWNDEMTLDQVGRLYGVSRERIRQIECGALAAKSLRYGLKREVEDDRRDPATVQARRRGVALASEVPVIEDRLRSGLEVAVIAREFGITWYAVDIVRARMRGAR